MRLATVLIVDDSELDRRLIAGLLRNNSALRIDLAQDGRQALDRVETSRPDLVITDLVMPEMDGLQLIRVLPARHPDIPLILLIGQRHLAQLAQDLVSLAGDACTRCCGSVAKWRCPINGLRQRVGGGRSVGGRSRQLCAQSAAGRAIAGNRGADSRPVVGRSEPPAFGRRAACNGLHLRPAPAPRAATYRAT